MKSRLPSLRLNAPRRALSGASGTSYRPVPCKPPVVLLAGILSHIKHKHAAALDGKQALPPARWRYVFASRRLSFPSIIHTSSAYTHQHTHPPRFTVRAMVSLSLASPCSLPPAPRKPLPGHHRGLCFYRCGQLRITHIMQNSMKSSLSPILIGGKPCYP